MAQITLRYAGETFLVDAGQPHVIANFARVATDSPTRREGLPLADGAVGVFLVGGGIPFAFTGDPRVIDEIFPEHRADQVW
ncbi:MAG: hypothetical protein LBG60_10785 [Bifidobacteriaceae bacterium]|jgi:hypothetical protein|nr:hypothetical protein [Bifidobacteriaceae bacterium]